MKEFNTNTNNEIDNFFLTEENEQIKDSILQTPVQNDILFDIDSP